MTIASSPNGAGRDTSHDHLQDQVSGGGSFMDLDEYPAFLTPAPLFNALAEGPEGGEGFWVRTTDRMRLRIGVWWPRGGEAVDTDVAPATPSAGTVFLLPGRTEYIEKYGRAAQVLTAAGYAMISIDWRGQGLADRTSGDAVVGDVVAFEDYQLDLDAMISAADALDLPRPYFLMAHSMGGCIALRHLQNRKHTFKAVSFSAPMWGIGVAAPLRALASGLSAVARLIGLGAKMVPGTGRETSVLAKPFTGNALTTDADMYAYMQRHVEAQPALALGGPSLRWVGLALRETAALSRAAAPDLPCITFLGTNERVVAPAAIHAMMGKWTRGRLVVVPGAEHEMPMELPAIRNAFFGQSIALFEEHP